MMTSELFYIQLICTVFINQFQKYYNEMKTADVQLHTIVG